MEKFFTLLISLMEKITLGRVLQIGLLVIFLLFGYIGYSYTPFMAESYSKQSHIKNLKELTKEDKEEIAIFMKKYKGSVIYLTVLRFDFPKNTRVPIYRSFNSDEIQQIITSRLNGGDGAIPIFIDNDKSNNNQIIRLIQGEMICSPFNDGGVSRVWPDLDKKFVVSCRMPIPPAFGVGVSGYIVVHMATEMRPYESEAMKLDLRVLAKIIHSNIK